jgi:hypothetical protein
MIPSFGRLIPPVKNVIMDIECMYVCIPLVILWILRARTRLVRSYEFVVVLLEYARTLVASTTRTKYDS